MLRTKPLRIVWLCLFCFVTMTRLIAQTEIDSLRNEVSLARGTEKIDKLFALSKILIRVNLEEAWELTNRGLQVSDSLGYDKGRIKGLLLKASLFIQQRNFDLAYEQLMSAETLSRELDAYLDPVDFKVSLGNVYASKGQYSKALEAYLDALKDVEATGNNVFLATCFQNISLVYQKTGKLDEATTYIHQAIELYEKEGMQLQIGQAYMNLGTLEYFKQNLGTAIETFKKGVEVFRETDSSPVLALALANLGFMYTNLGRHKEAFECYDESMAIREEINDLAGIGVLFLNRAKSFNARDLKSRAIAEGRKALEYAKTSGHFELKKNTLEFLSEVYEAAGYHNKALESYKAYTQVKDSLAEQANKLKVEELSASFEYEKKERELTASRKSLVNARKEQALSDSRQLVLIVAVVLLLLVIALLVYSYRNFMSKASLEKKYLSEKSRNTELSSDALQKELAIKEANLKDYAERIRQKNDLISDIESKLAEFEKEGSLSIKAGNIRDLALSVERKVVRNITWEEFRLRFDEVHKDFLANLVAQHADLTNNELDVCVLLKINLANKEIAQTLSMTYDSVKKSLQRLYKKLELNSNEELRAYIIRF